MKQVIAPLISIRRIVSDCYLMWLESPEIAAAAKPGQFVMVRCGEHTLLRRPLSIHQREGSKIALLFSVVGKGTAWLSQRRADDSIDIFGPLGNGFSISPTAKELLLLGGGMGIAPLNFLAFEAQKAGYSVTLCQGAKTKSKIVKEKSKTQALTAIAITEDGTAGHKGKVTDLIAEHIDWADQVFACGPTAMYRDMARKRREFLKAKPVQVSLEVRMGCGLGVCYGCTVKTKKGLKQVCRDGPVFNLDDILWDEPLMRGV